MSTLTGLVPPTRSILTLLDRAQQLGLEMERHLTHLVEQQRSAIRLLELT